MISESSSGDHLDCFFAGGSFPNEPDECRFVPAIVEGVDDVELSIVGGLAVNVDAIVGACPLPVGSPPPTPAPIPPPARAPPDDTNIEVLLDEVAEEEDDGGRVTEGCCCCN